MLERYSVKKPYTVFVGIVLVLVLGVISFTRMTTDLLPSMNFPYVIVYTSYVGATPEQIEEEVTRPMEAAFATLTNIKEISSRSSDSLSLVILQFNDTADMNTAMIEINSEITTLEAGWSDSVGAPVIMKINPDMLPVSIVSVSMEGMDIVELSEYVTNELIPEYESIDGVARVTASGVITREVDITIDQDRIDILNKAILREVNEELADVEDQLDEAQSQISSGRSVLARQRRTVLAQLDAAISTLNSAAGQISSGLEEMRTQRAGLQTQLDEVNAGIAQLEAVAAMPEEQKAALLQLQEQLGALQAQRERLEAELAAQENGEEAQALREQRASAVTERDALQAQIEGLDAYIADLENGDKAALSAEIDRLTDKLTQARGDLENAETALGEAESGRIAAQNRVDALEAALSGPSASPEATESTESTGTPAATEGAESTGTPAVTGGAADTGTPAATESSKTPTPAAFITRDPQRTDTAEPENGGTQQPADTGTPAPDGTGTPPPEDTGTPAPDDTGTPVPGDNGTAGPGDTGTPMPVDTDTTAPGGAAALGTDSTGATASPTAEAAGTGRPETPGPDQTKTDAPAGGTDTVVIANAGRMRAMAEDLSPEELAAELEAARAELAAAEDAEAQARTERDARAADVTALETSLAEKQQALSDLESGPTDVRIAAAEREKERLGDRVSTLDAEIAAIDEALNGAGGADATRAALAEVNASIEALQSSDAYKALQLILNEDETAARYAEAVAARSQLEAAIAQLDEIIGKLENNIIPGGMISGYDQDISLSAARSALVSGRSKAVETFDAAASALDEAASKLAKTRKEFEDKRDEALKNAGLDGIITVETVAGILGAQNLNMPAGYVYNVENDEYLVRVGDEFRSLEELKGTLLFSVGMDSVDEVRLLDVARVEITDDSEDVFTRVDGLNGILLSIEKQSTFSTTDVAEHVTKKSEALMAQIEGLKVVDMFNQGTYINIIVRSVLENLMWGGLLAILVLLIFLMDWRPTLIVAFSIPLSVVAAFVCMYFSHITLNVLSLSGLALGVGMLVDNSIVSIENIFRLRREEHMPVLHACVEGVRQVSGSLFASTLTTICVFLPVAFVSGMAHDLFTDLGLTIAFSLLASLVCAMTVVPAMSAGLMGRSRAARSGGLFDRFRNAYARTLRGALRIKPLVLLAAVGLMVFSAMQVPKMGISFMPEVNSTQMEATLAVDPDQELGPQQERAADLMDRMMTIEGIETVGLTGGGGLLGGGDSLTYYIIVQEDSGRKNADIAADIRRVSQEMGMELSVQTSTMDISMLTGSGISIDITGDDSAALAQAARDVAVLISDVEGVTEIDDGLVDSVPEIMITVDKEKAAASHLTVGQVYRFIAGKLAGKTQIAEATLDGSKMKLYLIDGRNSEITPRTLEDLETEVTSGDNSEMIRIGDVAEITETTSFTSIRRRAQQRTLSVTFQIAEGYSANLVSDVVEERLAAYTPPAGCEVAISGENETVMGIMQDLIFMVGVAVLLIFLIMVAQFQSLVSPLIVMFTIPLAFTGGLLSLQIIRMDLSIVAMIGFLVLSGVIVNNGIVFVDTVNQLRIKGMSKKGALVETGRIRLRPILMTALTTILGMSTMALARGMGAEMMQPMAVVTIGGLSYATLMTLFVVPCLYDMFNREKMRAREIRMAEEEAAMSGRPDPEPPEGGPSPAGGLPAAEALGPVPAAPAEGDGAASVVRSEEETGTAAPAGGTSTDRAAKTDTRAEEAGTDPAEADVPAPAGTGPVLKKKAGGTGTPSRASAGTPKPQKAARPGARDAAPARARSVTAGKPAKQTAGSGKSAAGASGGSKGNAARKRTAGSGSRRNAGPFGLLTGRAERRRRMRLLLDRHR